MGLFSWLKKKKDSNVDSVEGTLEYIPGSTTLSNDEPVVIDESGLSRRLFVQPADVGIKEHSNIPIYTGNPFRELVVKLHA